MKKIAQNDVCESCGNCDTAITVNRPPKLTKDLTTRLNKAEGQIKGIKGMIDKGCYCDDVLTQLSAVQSALSSVSILLLENHLKTCITERIKNDDELAIQELLKTIGRLL